MHRLVPRWLGYRECACACACAAVCTHALGHSCPVTEDDSIQVAVNVSLMVKMRSAEPQHPGRRVPLAAHTRFCHPFARRS